MWDIECEHTVWFNWFLQVCLLVFFMQLLQGYMKSGWDMKYEGSGDSKEV